MQTGERGRYRKGLIELSRPLERMERSWGIEWMLRGKEGFAVSSRTKEKEKGRREKQHQHQDDEDEGDGEQAVEWPQLRRSARMSKGKVTNDLGSNGDDGEEGGEEDEGDMEVEAPHKARSVKEK